MAQIAFLEMKSQINEFRIFLKDERKMKENTVLSYLRDINSFFSYCEDNGFLETSLMDEAFNDYTEHLKTTKSPATVSRNIASIRKFFRFLKDKGLIQKNPTKGVLYEKDLKSDEDFEVLTTDEIDKLIDSVKEESIKGYRDEAILETLYACGLKVSELINLKISDLSLNEGYITVTNDEHRYIPIYKGAVKAIRQYIKKGRKYLTNDKKNDFLFLTKDGKAFSRQGMWKLLKSLGKKAKLKKELTPHIIRRSMATHLLENGADIYDVQAVLGHKSVNQTKEYLRNLKPSVMSTYIKAHPKAEKSDRE